MTENEKEIRYIPSDLFDSKNYFHMIILSIMTARDDLNNINMLLDDKKEDIYMSAFIFKLSLGIAKNAYMLAHNVFKNDNYKDILKSMNNWEMIEEKYSKLVECNGGNDTASFSYKVLNEIRNQVFHYSYKNRDLDNISKIIEQLKNEELTIKISSEGSACYSTDTIFINYINKIWREYSGSASNDEVEQLSYMVKKIKEIVILLANLFDLISIGYLSSFTNIKESWDNESIKITKI